MTRYCAFFASMNVGGNRLRMADLRDALEREDLEDVETVVASGNVLFSFDERPDEGLTEMLSFIVNDRFGFPTFAAVRDTDGVRAAIEDNPFKDSGEAKFVHTLLLEREPEEGGFERICADYEGRGPEKLALGDRCLFVDYVGGVGDSRLTTGFIERRLGCRVTARNIGSLRRILEKMEGEG